MSERRLLLDRGPGETRGLVLLDGRPERLLIERSADVRARVGDRYAARVVRVERLAGLAFLDIGGGEEAVLRLKSEQPPPPQGSMGAVEITAEAQRGKVAVARPDGEVEGEPRRLEGRASAATRLQACAPRMKIEQGPDVRALVDEAEAEALAVEHALPGGGSVAIEPTRALVSVDVDLGGRDGVAGDVKRAARQANMAAIRETARLLRLKGLGGLIVIDLIGRGHDGQAIANGAKAAFAADQPGVVIGPITKFGTLELSLPQRGRSVAEILLGPDRRPTALTEALRLIRAIEREGRADPGGQLRARCAPPVARAAESLTAALAERIGRRFVIVADASFASDRIDIGRM